MDRLKPEKIKGIKISGIIIESSKKSLKFKIADRSVYSEKGIESRIQVVELNNFNFYQRPSIENIPLHLIYLNEESMKGLYKDSEKNLPYEILDNGFKLIYRQDALIRKKKDIFEELEKSAVEEGLK
jgi:hypothetical protein